MKYNEWMNEDDYECEDTGGGDEAKQESEDDYSIYSKSTRHGKGSIIVAGQTKSELAEDDDEQRSRMDTDGFYRTVAVSSNMATRLAIVNLDRKLPMKLKRSEYEPIPDGITLNISPPSLIQPKYQQSMESLESKDEFNQDGTTPSCPWFSMSDIHEMEVHAIDPFLAQSFFSGLDAKQQFIEMRNGMIEMYNSNPLEYLSFNTFLQNANVTEIHVALCIHNYLEHIGLINSRVSNLSCGILLIFACIEPPILPI